MIVSSLEWSCARCGKLHRRRLEQGSEGHTVRAVTDIEPRISVDVLTTVASDSGTVTYQLVSFVDLSCDVVDLPGRAMNEQGMTITDACEVLKEQGHTDECAQFWAAVLIMDKIGERWDHWTQPDCVMCDARRAAKEMK